MRFTVEFRPKPPLIKQVLALIEAEVLSWNNGLTMADMGTVGRYLPCPLTFGPKDCGYLSGTIVDRDGYLWRAKPQKKTFTSWDGKTGKQYKLNEIVAEWWLNKVTDEMREGFWKGQPAEPPKKPEQKMPTNTNLRMKGLWVEFADGGVWPIPDIEYEINPASEFLFYYKVDEGWCGIQAPDTGSDWEAE